MSDELVVSLDKKTLEEDFNKSNFDVYFPAEVCFVRKLHHGDQEYDPRMPKFGIFDTEGILITHYETFQKAVSTAEQDELIVYKLH